MRQPENAFDLLRLIAALAVLFSHNFPLLGMREPSMASGHTLGTIAVLIFFSISGYLVSQSLARSSSLGRFALKRFLRIYPGLVVALLFCALVVGPLFTTLPIEVYLSSDATWRSVLRFFGVTGEDRLPGVFETNPYPIKVNSSLWTIKYELICYVILGLIGAIASVSTRPSVRRWTFAGIFSVALIVLTLATVQGVSVGQVLGRLWGVKVGREFEYFARNFADFAAAFFFGAYIAESCSTILHRREIVVMAAVSIAVAIVLPQMGPMVPFAICVVSLWVATVAPRFIARLTRGEDLSYGVYIYAFPVQQSVVALGGGTTGYWGTLVSSLVVTLALAALSWRLVEKPSLELKRWL